jgi:hypothetical protein
LLFLTLDVNFSLQVPEGPRFLTAEISPTNRGGLRWKSELSRIGPQTDALYGDAAIAYMQEV